MKTKLILLSFLLLFSTININSQITIFKTISSGFVDKNPSFGAQFFYTWPYSNFEILVFERYINGVTRINAQKIDYSGPIDSVVYISNNSSMNKNPSIAANPPYYSANTYKTAMVVWENNQNGNYDVWGSKYSISGWSNPFIIASSSFNDTKPKICCIDSSNYFLVYERNDDIYFKRYLNNVWLADTNLTESEPLKCLNPNIIFGDFQNTIFVSYEKEINASQHIVNFSYKSSVQTNWSNSDTIAVIGNNRSIGIFSSYSTNAFECYFESSRTGKWNIYCTRIVIPNFKQQDSLANGTNSQNYGYVRNGSGQQGVSSYIQKNNFGTKIKTGIFNWIFDSTQIYTDTNHIIKISSSTGIIYNCFCGYYWIVFNKDSLTYSNIIGKRVQLGFSGIKKINSNTPEKYSLYQNYPNPFNPVTKIKFDVTVSPFEGGRGDVKLVIYNIQGKEIITLVNQQLHPGTYEVDWNASEYPSGVYFYTLESGDYSESKRMVLLK